MAEMVKTTMAYCKTCIYSQVITNETRVCAYISKTQHSRGCPVGYCDKKVKRSRRKKVEAGKETNKGTERNHE